jgi:hypothetical protein
MRSAAWALAPKRKEEEAALPLLMQILLQDIEHDTPASIALAEGGAEGRQAMNGHEGKRNGECEQCHRHGFDIVNRK